MCTGNVMKTKSLCLSTYLVCKGYEISKIDSFKDGEEIVFSPHPDMEDLRAFHYSDARISPCDFYFKLRYIESLVREHKHSREIVEMAEKRRELDEIVGEMLREDQG